MKIALVILHADPARGGAERYTVDLSGALARRGHEVSVLATSFAAALPQGVSTVPIRARGLSRLAQYNTFLDGVDRHLAGAGFDIVHAMLPVRRCHVYHPHAGVAAEAIETAHEKHARPIVRWAARWLNRLNRKRRRFADVERQLLSRRRPPVVLCLSQYVQAAVKRHYELPDRCMEILFNGVDLARFDPQARPEDREQVRRHLGLEEQAIVALMVAQDFERKGLREAILALARVESRELRLVVAGRPDPTPYRRLAEAQGVSGRVIFAGPVADMAALYRAADLLVLPTRHDPCSLVVLEALAMGLPVISTVQNGACEVMTDGREGYILPDPGDVSRLTAAYRALLDGERRGEMGEAALALRDRISYDAHLGRLLEIYGRAAGE